MKKKIAILLYWIAFQSHAQELNCTVTINSQRIQTQERQILQEMQSAIQNFMNTTAWTRDNFQQEEKIKVDIQFILLSGTFGSENTFTANIQINSYRPVYGTDYETPLLQYFDREATFTYNPSQQLIFVENAFSTSLTSLLAYYAYIILAYDYDSFSPKGGQLWAERALNIANIAEQNGGGKGWGSFSDTRDRYWLQENLLNPQLADFRTVLYDYHRKALDIFEKDNQSAKKVILECLRKIRKMKELVPMALVINNFFDTKATELINIFARAEPAMRAEFVEIATFVDPKNANEYRKLIRAN
ncbi:MAG: DUF4835 family protein [Cytophagales bacterium]|nr:DUF4835 family protein [Cytophagales bacterium]MDW8383972.1 DUF4835 family protein [Flammeovirgaceae bacterium]